MQTQTRDEESSSESPLVLSLSLTRNTVTLPFVEIVTIQVCDMVFVGTYIPDGRTLEGIQQWISTMDTLEESFPNKAVVALGDLNCRARTLGHSRVNESGPILDTWIQVSDKFDVYLFTEPTRTASQGLLDVVI